MSAGTRHRMKRSEVAALLDRMQAWVAARGERGASLREMAPALLPTYDEANGVKRAHELAERLRRAGRLHGTRCANTQVAKRYFGSHAQAAAWVEQYVSNASSLAAVREQRRRGTPLPAQRAVVVPQQFDAGEFARLGPGRYAEPPSLWVAAAVEGAR